MRCITCGTENPEGTKVCSMCGADLTVNQSQNYGEAKPTFQFAGFGKRFAAILIDGLILSIPSFILIKVLNVDPTVRDSAYTTYQLLSIVISLVYFTGLESSSKQATVGKMALGIKVVDYNGNRIGLGKALARYLCKIISAFILCIGFIMAAFTEKKQALHDLMANTYVINK